MNGFDADIYAVGHVHGQSMQQLTKVARDQICSKYTEKRKLGVITGAYFKTYARGTTTYAEVMGYMPSTLGAVVITIQPYTRHVSTGLGAVL